MTLLAHLSDLHLLERDHERRHGLARRRLQLLNIGMRADAAARLEKVTAAFMLARKADHLVLTGDLTEDGASGQFEALGEAIRISGWDPSRVTIVPGNHDAYDIIGAFERAGRGPLRGCNLPGGGPVHLGDVIVVPLSTMIECQWRARGRILMEDIARVRRIGVENPGVPIVVVQHHPPFHHDYPVWEWFDGVENATHLHDLLIENPAVHVVHGHLHEKTTVKILDRPTPQIMSVASVREQPLELALRFYEAKGPTLVPRFHVVD